MKILAIDQARHGGYSIWDYEAKKLISFGSYNFPSRKFTFPQAVNMTEKLVENLMQENDIDAVFIEDINLRYNAAVFKSLAQLQGVLINLFEKNKMLYATVPPSTWQAFCKARGRTKKEVHDGIVEANTTGKSQSKVLSIEFVHDNFHIDTSNDNIADAVCIGWYVVNKMRIDT